MDPAAADWQDLPALQGKDAAFVAAVAKHLTVLETLNQDQKHRLALFKAAELINAVIQMRETREDPARLGPELAHASFALIRAAIRNRSLALSDGQPVSLKDPEVRALIDHGCRLFHLGKSDPDVYAEALALSAAQCIALHHQLSPALQQYIETCGLALPDSLVGAVQEAFITSYEP